MGEIFAGRYEFVDLLDEGGMGTIWRVWDERQSCYRAAKMLKQSDGASLIRFVRETSWRIDHDHVVAPIGWSGEDDRVLFTMPLVGGGTVASLIKDFGPLPDRWTITLLDQLLAALIAVHDVGLVHRDIKPSNLLLEATGRDKPHLRLTDFGIAAPIDDPRLTRVGDVIGTPAYLAPEARLGADPDPRQDLYAAGLVAVEMITGTRPERGCAMITPAVTDGPLGPVLARLLAEDPADRFASAEAARAEVATIRLPQVAVTDDDVEVLGHLPPLPLGWGPDGPATRTHRRPSSTSAAPAQPVGSPVGSPVEPPTGQPGRQPAEWSDPPPTEAVEAGSGSRTPVADRSGFDPATGAAQVPATGRLRRRRTRLSTVAFCLIAGGLVCVVAAIAILLQ
ncbi:serine/threonine-protein kinase [Microlunatus speluncae]|uniref:serine/threonine-protein kinase n=1 Tax=Microlunatus speluncae TaxID=2594267 RepID=UPI001375C890|nr:serine/threonine-protein kinase [Microlunatus speluncae]